MVLRVTLQVVPFGDEDRAYEIGRLDIFNKGPCGEAHEYGCIDLSPKKAGLYQDNVIHFRDDGAWELVRNAIETLEIKGP
jgi:hypothetical protein